jgi:hypothetical protein
MSTIENIVFLLEINDLGGGIKESCVQNQTLILKETSNKLAFTPFTLPNLRRGNLKQS